MSSKNDINRRVAAIQAKKKRHRNGKPGKNGGKNRSNEENNSTKGKGETTHRTTRGRETLMEDEEECEEILGKFTPFGLQPNFGQCHKSRHQLLSHPLSASHAGHAFLIQLSKRQTCLHDARVTH
jgi:hypothetical protein